MMEYIGTRIKQTLIKKNMKNKHFFDNPKSVTILAAVLIFHRLIFMIIPGGVALTAVLLPISFICSVVGFTFVIYVRVKFPEYKPAKVLFWLVIITFIILLVLIIWFIKACISSCTSCFSVGFLRLF